MRPSKPQNILKKPSDHRDTDNYFESHAGGEGPKGRIALLRNLSPPDAGRKKSVISTTETISPMENSRFYLSIRQQERANCSESVLVEIDFQIQMIGKAVGYRCGDFYHIVVGMARIDDFLGKAYVHPVDQLSR